MAGHVMTAGGRGFPRKILRTLHSVFSNVLDMHIYITVNLHHMGQFTRITFIYINL